MPGLLSAAGGVNNPGGGGPAMVSQVEAGLAVISQVGAGLQ